MANYATTTSTTTPLCFLHLHRKIQLSRTAACWRRLTKATWWWH